MNKVELMAPVASEVMLTAAIDGGADSVYFGIGTFNMRVNAKSPQLSKLKRYIDICHKNKVKAYLTVNTIIYEDEIKKVESLLRKAKQAGIDSIICWDLSVIQLCKNLKIPFCISTQASISNSRSAEFYKKLGAKRIVLARECSLEQIKEIRKKTRVEIEVFGHGAMCVAVSGRCFTSQFLFGKSANRGDCLQPCRREYTVTDEEDRKLRLKNNFVMSAKDLNTIPFIDKLLDTGIDALKIEGRMRSPEYVKTVTRCYRKAIDFYYKNNKNKDFKKDFEKLKKELVKKLKKVYNRDFSSGFYLGQPIDEFTDEYGSKATEKKEYIGYVVNFYKKNNVAEIKVESNIFKKDDLLMFQGNKTGVLEEKASSLEIDHKKVKKAIKGKTIAAKLKNIVRTNDKVFVIK